MNKVLSILAAAVLAGGGLAPAAMAAETAGRMRVEDKAGAFTPDGIKKAEEAFADTSFRSPTHFTVVTVGEIPAARKRDFDAVAKDPEQRGRFFESWARELADAHPDKGVFVLMFVGEKRYIVRAVADKASDVYRHFTDADAHKLVEKLSAGCRRALGQPADQAKAERDAALLDATGYVVAQLKDTSVPVVGERTRAASSDSNGNKGGTNILGYVCIGLAVLLGIWLVVGIIRAFTGGGGGYGGGGYGGGFGGGGFFPSLMGGLFGAAAGMWLYDSFMGGHHSASASDAMGGYGGDTGASDTGEGNYDEGASAGSEGGDWGDAGGGDAGGGDWGGDAGGDFGGGDFGGGDFGGGDW
ncbi:MAG TPA: hypothetical protein VFG68_08130 [Fimbriiglobus sp.]|nr:hypothetical protein [Fimbriiglobus sp.]